MIKRLGIALALVIAFCGQTHAGIYDIPLTETAISATTSVNLSPTSHLDGHLQIAYIVLTVPQTITGIPSGWAAIGPSPTTTGVQLYLYAHCAAAGDAPPYTWSWGSSASGGGRIIDYVDDLCSQTPVDSSTSTTNLTVGSLTLSSITASNLNEDYMVFTGTSTGTRFEGVGNFPVTDNQLGSNISEFGSVGGGALPCGASSTKVTTISGTTNMVAVALFLKPAATQAFPVNRAYLHYNPGTLNATQTVTATALADVQSGDAILAWIFPSAGTVSSPASGFTQKSTTTDASSRNLYWYCKDSTGSEPTQTWTLSGANKMAAWEFALARTSCANIDQIANVNNASAATSASTSVTTVAANEQLFNQMEVGCGSLRFDTAPNVPLQPAHSGECITGEYNYQPTAGASGSQTFTLNGNAVSTIMTITTKPISASVTSCSALNLGLPWAFP